MPTNILEVKYFLLQLATYVHKPTALLIFDMVVKYTSVFQLRCKKVSAFCTSFINIYYSKL